MDVANATEFYDCSDIIIFIILIIIVSISMPSELHRLLGFEDVELPTSQQQQQQQQRQVATTTSATTTTTTTNNDESCRQPDVMSDDGISAIPARPTLTTDAIATLYVWPRLCLK